MSNELKPCLFCGGEVKMDNEQITATITVDYFICEKCGATVHFEYADKTAEAIEAWNTRKPIDDIVEQLEEEAHRERMSAEFRLAGSAGYNEAKNIAKGIDRAIEIVKGGAE